MVRLLQRCHIVDGVVRILPVTDAVTDAVTDGTKNDRDDSNIAVVTSMGSLLSKHPRFEHYLSSLMLLFWGGVQTARTAPGTSTRRVQVWSMRRIRAALGRTRLSRSVENVNNDM